MPKSTSQFEGSSFALSKWEDAGESLSNALSAYLTSCKFVETFSPKSGSGSQQLATHIDLSLNSLHTKLVDELAQSRVGLARIRNKSLSWAYRLPNEIISEIFVDVVCAPVPDNQRSLNDRSPQYYVRTFI
ncbi:hypothetical protein B0J17DRAFT_723538 [Rhizoctonia solani]|nr:hypothetical protein B0J17DRAFT_723538 [Rhizoctonia solani]